VAAALPDRYPELTISFRRADTDDPQCVIEADRLFEKFTAPHAKHPERGAYQDGCSILVLPDTFDEYWNGPAGYATRRKVRKALKEGYSFGLIDRNAYLDDIFAINTSMEERQGRAMTEAYRTKPEPFSPLPAYRCPHHQIRTYGVLKDGHLVAYTWLYQEGEMCLFSTILGHGAHLNAGVMYLLVAETIRDVMATAGTRYAMYNMHVSGTEGLRFFKEQMGFRPYWVNWQRNDEAPEPRRLASQRSRKTGRFTPRRIVRGVARRLGLISPATGPKQ
jgi:Acetyltransferase (GNAT) domain